MSKSGFDVVPCRSDETLHPIVLDIVEAKDEVVLAELRKFETEIVT